MAGDDGDRQSHPGDRNTELLSKHAPPVELVDAVGDPERRSERSKALAPVACVRSSHQHAPSIFLTGAMVTDHRH